MMPILMEDLKRAEAGCCRREQAAALLEELREQYRGLSRTERGAVQGHLSDLADMQFAMDGEEN